MSGIDIANQKTVLVVDDSNIMRRLVSEIVEMDPAFRVIDTAENGKIALQKVRTHKPDCVLLDIEMPELSGIDTMRRLGLRSQSKVVILSALGYEGSAARAEALRLGAADVIEKPSGSVSMDIKTARGSIINQTLRRVLGLPAFAPEDTTEEGTARPPPAPAAAPVVAPPPPVGSSLQLQMLEAASLGALAFDADARLAYVNPAALRLLSKPALNPGAHGVDDVFDEVNEFLADEVREVIASGEAKPATAVDYMNDAGEWIPFSLSITPTQGAAGALVLIEDKSVEQSLRRVLDQTMSPSISEAVINGEALDLDGRASEATILFSDIRGFTSLCESMDAKALVTLLNEYFTFMADVIRGKDGVVDKYIGDAIMALFGVPKALPSSADSAVSACIGMVSALDMFNGDRKKLGQPALNIGIGLATGSVIAGNIGSPERKNYTVIGDAVNLSARIEGLTKAYGARILICEATFAALKKPAPHRRVDVVQVKGQETATTLYEIFCEEPAGQDAEIWLRDYDKGLRAYEAGNFSDAADFLRSALWRRQNDEAAATLLRRCDELIETPQMNWRGVWRLESKVG